MVNREHIKHKFQVTINNLKNLIHESKQRKK